MRQRRGSVVAFAISLTAVFLTVIVATMAYFETANRQANHEKWGDVAEEAARSGLDFVIGWGEDSLDEVSRLPTTWEMNDGQVIDPVRMFELSGHRGVTFGTKENSTSALPADPSGAILGSQVGEYVLGRVGNYIVSFKARVQQFRMSDDAPRQYRIGIVGRVRKSTSNNVNSDEARDIVGERFLMATLGKEPFSRYAALIDIDLVRNWIPGEEVNGPVHINRGYIDKPAQRNLQWTSQTFKDERSMMKLKTAFDASNGFQAVSGAGAATNNPVFNDTVSMTAYNDRDDATNGKESDDSSPDNTAAVPVLDGASFLSVDNLAPTNATAKTRMGAIFLSPDNLTSFKGGPGPIIVPSPIPLPVKSRQRIPTALGLPSGTALSACAWYPTLEDGLYVPTASWGTTQVGSTSPSYSTGAGSDLPAGGIYLRGNVEVMRMYVSGANSYYMFQMGYGGWADAGSIPNRTSVRRCYMVKADRVNSQLTIRAFSTASAKSDPYALYNLLAASGCNFNPEYYFSTVTGNPSDTGTDWTVKAGTGDIQHVFKKGIDVNQQHPFNGIIFVDASLHDPQFNTSTGVPITGNIFALGDPGLPADPYTKPAWPNGERAELVSTTADAVPWKLGPASKLTIVTAGHIFIQNDIKVEGIRQLQGNTATTTDGDDPQMDAVTLSKSRDLIGLVADRQVVIGLAAPSTPGVGARKRKGIVVHAAVAALGDPAPTARSGQLAYWGSFTTEGLLPCFGDFKEDYGLIDLHGAGAALPGGTTRWGAGVNKFVGETYNPNNRNMPGNPYFLAYTNSITLDTNPNNKQRGRLTMFGSLTQRKRGAIGYGNSTYDKDLRYDKRLLSIAPPIFPSSATVGLRVSTVRGAGVLPYRGKNGNVSPVDADYDFMATPSSDTAKPAGP